MFSSRALHNRTIVSVLLALFQFSSPTAEAQEVNRLFPSRDLLPYLLAAPRAPKTGAGLVANLDSPTEFGETVDGEVAIGTAIPLFLISGTDSRDALVLGIEGAVFGRFALKPITRDMISTDWVFALPVVWHRGDNWLQLRYRHISSHLGDEYINRFEAEVENFSRDAADITLFHRVAPSFGLYGGGAWAFNIRPDGSRRFLVRFGAQIETVENDKLFLPYFALDVQWEEDNDWEPRLNTQLGVRLPKIQGRRSARIAIEYLAGPSPMGQFHEEHVRHVALGLHIDP